MAARGGRRQAARPATPALSGGGTAARSLCGCGAVHGAARGAASGAAHGAARGAAHGAAQGAARGAGRGARRGAAPMAFQSYGDPDNGNSLPPFRPSLPVGVYFGCHLRNMMTTAVEFFHLFFSPEMVGNICEHTNSYANKHIISGSHQSYMQSDGSWKDTTPEEINRMIALLIYFGLVKVGVNIDRYWSTKTLYHGLWARSIMTRNRFRALMALLHVVDPTTKNPGDKLCKVESFIAYFKSRCLALYQPRQQLAIDERMVKSRHRSGIR